MLNWIKTADQLPPLKQVVLGYWPINSIETVVRNSEKAWNAPGYLFAEYRAVPLYWAEVTNLPPGHSVEE